MGRYSIVVGATALSLILTASMLAQGPQQQQGHFRAIRPRPRYNESRPGADRFYQLSPEERQAFQRNAERWLKMTPEQQKMLREREMQRRQQMRIEAEAAMRQLGLRLDDNARNQFEARYFQERRKIEHELRQEVEAKRQQQLPQLNERLKSEFQPRQGSAASPVNPAPSPRK